MDTTRKTLLQRVRDSADHRAWREFDGLYRPMLQRFAQSSGLRDTEAEEVAQHCMAAIATHIRTFEYDPSKGRFRGWLRTLVNNHIRNQRARRREQGASTDVFNVVPDDTPLPDERFEEIWLDEHLKHAMRLLQKEVEPLSFRVYQDHVLNEWPVAKTCEAHKVNENQLYSIKWRLTHKLQKLVQELMGEDASGDSAGQA